MLKKKKKRKKEQKTLKKTLLYQYLSPNLGDILQFLLVVNAVSEYNNGKLIIYLPDHWNT